MSNFSLEQLTEGIRERHLGNQNSQLVEKWSRTGLLRGLDGIPRENMARMLENQASQVLKEASDLGGGTAASSDIRGFSNIAFPIVRRVFGGLIANDLVSIQPMSLPSGLLFYLDYTYGDNVGGEAADAKGGPYRQGESIYNNPVGKGVRSGSLGAGGQYDLAGAGYTRARGKNDLADIEQAVNAFHFTAAKEIELQAGDGQAAITSATITDEDRKFLQFDPQILQDIEDGGSYSFLLLPVAHVEAAAGELDRTMIREVTLSAENGQTLSPDHTITGGKIQSGLSLNVRRLNQLVSATRTGDATNVLITAALESGVKADPLGGNHILFVVNNAGVVDALSLIHI